MHFILLPYFHPTDNASHDPSLFFLSFSLSLPSSFLETNCPGGQSWSPDLEKCMDCSVCQRQNKNDFCSTCGDPQPTNTFNLWVLVGASLGAVLLASIIAGTIIYARCRRREKFTTPIEETGGHSAQESLIH
uniref:Tumor necrosis factor receptor superfamily member 12A n=1 Tax=Laticauda laticaudata TaxID=8630 RepID=A0A8C5RHT3_LATLA